MKKLKKRQRRKLEQIKKFKETREMVDYIKNIVQEVVRETEQATGISIAQVAELFGKNKK